MVDIIDRSVEADLFDAVGVKVLYLIGYSGTAYTLMNTEGFTFYPQYDRKFNELALRILKDDKELAALYSVTKSDARLPGLELAILESLMDE